MLQSKQRLLELNAKLAETLTSKGVAATADETTTSLINKVSDISSGGDDSVLAGLIDHSIESIVIPDGVKSIGDFIFYRCVNLKSIVIPESVTSIGISTFFGCASLKTITIPDNVTSIAGQAFRDCTNLMSVILPNNITTISMQIFYQCSNITEIVIPNGVLTISKQAFYSCTNLASVTIPNSVTNIDTTSFQWCKHLKELNLEDGFNANNLNLSASNLIERETIVNMFNALADRTGLSAYTLTLGSANLAKLTEQDILIATNKNWTLA